MNTVIEGGPDHEHRSTLRARMAAKVPWTRRPQVTALRKRSRLADAAVGMLDGFRVHQSSTGSALVTYFGFISIFPLFLVFTTVLGFVLEGNPELRDDIVDSALAKLPLIGPKLAASPEALEGSVVALVVGLLLALWSGTKAFIALQTALDNTNEVPVDDRNSFVQVRIRALGGIVVIGLAQAGSAALSGIVAAAGLPALGNVGLVGAAALLNALVLSFSYRWLTSRSLTWRSVVPGSVLAGVLFSLLQVVGSSIITRSQSNAESMYGDFATVIALLGWLSLHATVALMGAELNRALATSPYDGDGDGALPVAPATFGTVDDAAPAVVATPAAAGADVVAAARSAEPRVHGDDRRPDRIGEGAAAPVGVEFADLDQPRRERGEVDGSGVAGITAGRSIGHVQHDPAATPEVRPQGLQGKGRTAAVVGVALLALTALVGVVTGRQSNDVGDPFA